MFLKIIGWLPWSYISIFLIGMMFMCLIQGVLIYYWLLSSNSSNHNFSSIPSVNSHTFPQQLLDVSIFLFFLWFIEMKFGNVGILN